MPEGLAIEWVLVPIGFLGALVYGITGFGSALVTIPLATHFVPLPFALAVFVLFYGAWSLLRRGVPRLVHERWAYVAGFSGGVVGMLFGAGGPPYAIYLSHRGLSKEQFRSTLTLNSIFSVGFRVVALASAGLLFRSEVWMAAALVVPAAMLAIFLASRLFRRISRELLLRLVALLLLATGASLIGKAL